MKKIEGYLERNKRWRIRVARSAILMLVAARLILPYHQAEKEEREPEDESGNNNNEFAIGLLPFEIQEYIVWQVGGNGLTPEEKKLVLAYAEQRDTLHKDRTRSKFLSTVIKTITYWPESGSVVPARPVETVESKKH